MDERETCINLAKLSESAERYDDMAENMKKVASEYDKPLSTEERNLLSVAYKNVVGARRASWRILSSLEQKSIEKNDGKHHLNSDYRVLVEKELNSICDDVISLLDNHLIPKGDKSDNDSMIFYKKMKGDYYRYKVEVASASETNDKFSALSEEAYTEAYTLAKEALSTTSPIRLGLALNFSVYYYEIAKKPDKAKELAKDAFDQAISDLDEDANETKDSTLILQLLRDNLTLWTAEDAGQEDEQDRD
ncbi:hypothetical protein FSP39_009831 [Pinctada imbricata]|uniref:14-3-3 domain-containing protein n=1 Tax=Pinctada imbricata TaxID=66713 RepID=A0AA88YG30_PINIB|nr:hypothetical protein FSP39_009831 [Pinctada imbricata]